MKITGTLINYFMHCKRQCYLFYHNVVFEHNSELVKIGKNLHEKKKKTNDLSEVSIDNIRIDKLTDKHIIEYKKSNADTDATTAQLKYYIYVLNQKGVIRDGKIEFLDKSKEPIIVKNDNELSKDVESLISELQSLLQEKIPEAQIKSTCKKCAYFEYCSI